MSEYSAISFLPLISICDNVHSLPCETGSNVFSSQREPFNLEIACHEARFSTPTRPGDATLFIWKIVGSRWNHLTAAATIFSAT